MSSRALEVDRSLVAAAVVLTCVLFTPSSLDPVNVVKLTALLLCAIALVVSVTVRAARDRVVHLPVGVAGTLAGLLLIAFVVSAVVAPVTTTAVLGAYGRNSGLLAYVAALVLFVVGLRVFDRPGARVLVGGVVAAGLFTATYGLLQQAGIDRIPWNNPFNPIIASLGNPNFASGYLGIAASVAAGGALWAGWQWGWRIACAVTGALCLTAAVLTVSVQGPIAAVAGGFVVAVAFALERTAPWRGRALTGLGAVAVVGTVVLLLGAVRKVGPLGAQFADRGAQSREFYWGAALSMFSDRPLFGVGLDQYGSFWRAQRSPDSVGFLPGGSFADAAHSVPLQMLAQGGVLLGVVYLLFVGFTGSCLVRGLLRLQGTERMLLAAVGAGWTAYQVQSLVSIDQVPLLVLHFALASAVIAASGQAVLREVRLPGALSPVVVHPNDAGAERRAAEGTPRRRTTTGADAAVIGLAGVLAVLAGYQAVTPLRANSAAKQAAEAISQGDGATALAAYEKAQDLVPGQALYATLAASLLERVSPPQPTLALESYERAVEADPYDVGAVRAAARLAETNGSVDRSRDLWRQAARLEPYNERTLADAASFELRHDGAQAARDLLEPVVAQLPPTAVVLAVLGDARSALGDADGAKDAYDRALGLEPGNPLATAGLSRLAARIG